MKAMERISRVRFRREEGFAAKLGYTVQRRDWGLIQFGRRPLVPPIVPFVVTRITRRFVTLRMSKTDRLYPVTL